MLGRGREMSLTTKFVTELLTSYSLKLEITIANIDHEIYARSMSDIPNEPSQQPYKVDTMIRPILQMRKMRQREIYILRCKCSKVTD